MNKKLQIFSIFFAFAMLSSLLNAQTITFAPGNETPAYTKYNIAMSTATPTPAGAGGFTTACTVGCNDGNTYKIQVSFDGGNTWYSDFETMIPTTGTVSGSGRFFSADGVAQVSISHDVFDDLSSWPGDDGTIKLRVYESETQTYYPPSPVTWTLDLTRPTIESSSIISNNGTNTAYATTDDEVKISITASEPLANDDNYGFSGQMAALPFETRAGSDATEWEMYITVSTHAEQNVDYSIVYYDENYNTGASNIQFIPGMIDGSTVKIDRTAATVTASISSNNTTNTLAIEDDVVTLVISSTEVLNAAPTITIDGNAATPNPTTPADSYTATRTMALGDTQVDGSGDPTPIPFRVTKESLIDRAGNVPDVNLTTTNDASSVTFDSTPPTITGITIESDNALDPTLAMPGDEVTIEFYTSDPTQEPVAKIATLSTNISNDNLDQVSWSAKKTMDVDDPNGQVAFTVDYFDLAGNPGGQVVSIMSGSNVTFDKLAPAINSVVVTSSNTDFPTLAISGQIISVVINADVPLSSITGASIEGNAITGISISELTPSKWKFSYTLDGSEDDGSASYAFTMTDLAGNTTDISEEDSDVTIDNTAPELTFIGIESNNSNTAYAQEDNKVTLTINSDTDLSVDPDLDPLKVYLAGESITPVKIAGSAKNYTAEIDMADVTIEGLISISITFSDIAGNLGNSGDPVTATTNGTSVILDKQDPTLSRVDISSNNTIDGVPNPAFAKFTEIITLEFDPGAADVLQDPPTVTIAENAVTPNFDGTTWTATYTMTALDDDGVIPFTIVFEDLAGNDGDPVADELLADTDGEFVTYDQTPPTLNLVTMTSDNDDPTLAKVLNEITLVIASASDLRSPDIEIASNPPDGLAGNAGDNTYTATYTMTQVNTNALTGIPFTVDYKDMAGNSGEQVTLVINDGDGVVKFDKILPELGDNITIESNNALDPTFAKEGDEIEVTFNFTKDIIEGGDPDVKINEHDADVERTTGKDDEFTATYTMTSDDAAINDDYIPFSILNFTDRFGNDGTDALSGIDHTTDLSKVKYDIEVPTLQIVTIASDNTNSRYS